jgi:hypothetical protein
MRAQSMPRIAGRASCLRRTTSFRAEPYEPQEPVVMGFSCVQAAHILPAHVLPAHRPPERPPCECALEMRDGCAPCSYNFFAWRR